MSLYLLLSTFTFHVLMLEVPIALKVVPYILDLLLLAWIVWSEEETK